VASRFQVFEEREINLARGDRIQITRNGKSADGRRVNNGNVFTIEKFGRDGKIVLNTGAVLDAKHGHFTYGYCQTSHTAQSKSVRDVLVAQSADSFLASSREQFYVSVSRGKQSIRIYTDNRLELQEAVGGSSTRRAGIELAGFSAKEVSSLVSGESGARQWRDHVQSRKAEGEAKSHVQNLLRERKDDGMKKTESMDFRQYIEMRRALAGADGKSRSKGHPTGEGKGKAETQSRGRSFLRPTELKTPPKEKIAAANENKKTAARKPAETQSREGRMGKAYEAARNHFKKATEKVKSTIDKVKDRRANQLPKNNTAQVSKHAVKQRAADARPSQGTQAKVKQNTPAPVVRRGR
jgi:hypothetical protein